MEPLYWIRSENFGDKINPILYKLLSGRYPDWADKTDPQQKIFFVGSTAQDARANDVIFGAGLISADAGFASVPKVLATRGPLTEIVLERAGAEVPHVYGDPAVLMGLLYSPRETMDRGYIGVIPHYVDYERVAGMELPHTSKIINITQRDPLRVIDEIAAARYVVSSCLHGIVIAGAFGVPAVWAEFSDGVAGAGFKFRDYYYGVGREPRHPVDMRSGWKDEDPDYWRYGFNSDVAIRLLGACPFLDPDLKRWLSLAEYREEYDERTKMLANLVRPGERVLHLGAGRNTLRDYLPPYTTLITSDLTRMLGVDIVANLNDDSLQEFPVVDVAVMGGLLEYIHNIPRLVEHLSRTTNSIALSYACGNPDAVMANGWKNNIARSTLRDILARYGYNKVIDAHDWHGQMVARFDKS